MISLELIFHSWGGIPLGRKRIKPYPSVEDLPRPVLRVAMPGAERCPLFFSRRGLGSGR